MIVHGLDLRHLEIFARVVKEGGITQAARSLGLTQPTVSGHMRSLEEETGTVLLHRGGGRARPTAAGELLQRYASQICALKADALVELERFLGLRQGEMRLGASTTPATWFLPPHLTRFHQLHPAVRVEVVVGDTKEILSALEEGRIEAAIVGAEVDEERYQARRLATDPIVLTVGKSHPWASRPRVKLEELRGQPMIVREDGSATHSSVEQLLAAKGLHMGQEIPIALRLTSNEAIREAIAQGGLAAFLPRACLVGRTGDLKAIEIEGLKIERPFMLVLSLSREPGPSAKAFLKMLEEKVA
jgi:DNA-binding transcriptional LysR family regulator